MRCTSVEPSSAAAHLANAERSGLVGDPTQMMLSRFAPHAYCGSSIDLSHAGHGGRSAYGRPQYV